MPAALHEYDGGFLVRLLQGLSGYDESLYREWLLNHPMQSETADEGESRRMLSYHRYSQDTSLLLGIFNHVGALTCGLMETKNGKHPEFTPILPPDTEQPKKPVAASLDSIKALFSSR